MLGDKRYLNLASTVSNVFFFFNLSLPICIIMPIMSVLIWIARGVFIKILVNKLHVIISLITFS